MNHRSNDDSITVQRCPWCTDLHCGRQPAQCEDAIPHNAGTTLNGDAVLLYFPSLYCDFMLGNKGDSNDNDAKRSARTYP